MKYFPFKVLVLCILLPPVAYILTIQLLEQQLERTVEKEIRKIYLGETEPLFSGTVSVQQAVTRNIDRYLARKKPSAWGVRVQVTVATRQGNIIYPLGFETDEEVTAASLVKTAAENYQILDQGLVLSVDLTIEHARLLSGLVLGVFIAAALLVFFGFYRVGVRRARADEHRRLQEVQRLENLQKDYQTRLSVLNREQETLSSELEQVKEHFAGAQKQASINEDEMIEEIDRLEKKLTANLDRQEEQRAVIDELKAEIQQFESGKRKVRREKVKEAAVFEKRFNTLYKKSMVHPKAVDGFTDLTAELQLKAEEIIHQLNEDPALVPVKRKVFGKKNRETVFEVIFAYKGRLYYRLLPDKRVEVLSIGTKHTQSKDLAFLNNL